MDELIRLNENVCDEECGGCSCHLSPPCSHCTDHMITQEYKNEIVQKFADTHGVTCNIVQNHEGKDSYNIDGPIKKVMAMIEDLHDEGIDLKL